MRFAYADPPYLGCCRLYDHHHPDGLCGDNGQHLPCYCCGGKTGHAGACPVPVLGPAEGLCRCATCAALAAAPATPAPPTPPADPGGRA